SLREGAPRRFTLTDAGPLVALIDAGEPRHEECVEAFEGLALPLVTTWPAFTEAMHLLGRHGTRAQQTLWKLVESARLVLAELSPAAVARSARLMTQYADQP